MSAAVMLTPAAGDAAPDLCETAALGLCANVCACVERIRSEASRNFLESKTDYLS
jgi:hypothetical protein